MRQSSLNLPSKPSSSAFSGTRSLSESRFQGSDHVYTVLGFSNQRTGITLCRIHINLFTRLFI
jgi:hypothetical protein